ncbi:hypothetical protein NQ318_013518 [Aromia moschata]|uniref:Uncharacterized protein n=1 Tax=Aromia moschata TaxID=1265417 RepID=A0AAV8YD27_9CUCU|nr:hypothetical protein NQ318_013518 [Aromia moschata]
MQQERRPVAVASSWQLGNSRPKGAGMLHRRLQLQLLPPEKAQLPVLLLLDVL